MFGLASSLWVLRLFSRGECHESQVAFGRKEEQNNEIVYCEWYDWSVIWSCDLDHVKAKQENAFPHSEGTHTRWKDYPCFARLVILIFMVFWHQSTLCKVINQAANSVNFDLPAFSSVQATSVWRVLYHRIAKSLSRKLKNEGAKDLSVTPASSVSVFKWKTWKIQKLGTCCITPKYCLYLYFESLLFIYTICKYSYVVSSMYVCMYVCI